MKLHRVNGLLPIFFSLTPIFFRPTAFNRYAYRNGYGSNRSGSNREYELSRRYEHCRLFEWRSFKNYRERMDGFPLREKRTSYINICGCIFRPSPFFGSHHDSRFNNIHGTGDHTGEHLSRCNDHWNWSIISDLSPKTVCFCFYMNLV